MYMSMEFERENRKREFERESEKREYSDIQIIYFYLLFDELRFTYLYYCYIHKLDYIQMSNK